MLLIVEIFFGVLLIIVLVGDLDLVVMGVLVGGVVVGIWIGLGIFEFKLWVVVSFKFDCLWLNVRLSFVWKFVLLRCFLLVIVDRLLVMV